MTQIYFSLLHRILCIFDTDLCFSRCEHYHEFETDDEGKGGDQRAVLVVNKRNVTRMFKTYTLNYDKSCLGQDVAINEKENR